jgi:hypothetical protein
VAAAILSAKVLARQVCMMSSPCPETLHAMLRPPRPTNLSTQHPAPKTAAYVESLLDEFRAKSKANNKEMN